jgi:hypothetical protein
VDLSGVWSVPSDGEQDDLHALVVGAWANLLARGAANLHWAPAPRNIKAPFTRSHQIKSHRRGCGVVHEVALEASHLTCPSGAWDTGRYFQDMIIIKSEGADGK